MPEITRTRRPNPQWRLSSWFVWMIVLSILLSILPWRDPRLSLVLSAVFAPPMLCLPMLLNRWWYRDERGLQFSDLEASCLVFCLGIYSLFMCVSSSIVFSPDWRGHKGPHPFYYLNEYPVAATFWPLYAGGVLSFMRSVTNVRYAQQSRWNFCMIATCVLISLWYVVAVLCFKFSNEPVIAFIPGSVGVAYGIYCGVLLKYGDYDLRHLAPRYIVTWIIGFAAAIVTKFPMSVRYYEQLPSSPPADCFVVSAASRGHVAVVKSRRDPNSGRLINDQLLTLWQLESVLAIRFPAWHRRFRSLYDRWGPRVARRIRFRWQADLVYLALKPVEWAARWILR